MEKKIEDILRHTDLKEWQIEDITKELLDLYNVSKCSECNDDMTQEESHFCCSCYLANN